MRGMTAGLMDIVSLLIREGFERYIYGLYNLGRDSNAQGTTEDVYRRGKAEIESRG